MDDTDNGAAGSQPLPLDRLPQGVAATVAGLCPPQGADGAQDERGQALLVRLMEIGFLPGEPVRIIARGFPAADPLAVRVGQATFALRRHEAALVQVRVDAASGAGGAA